MKVEVEHKISPEQREELETMAQEVLEEVEESLDRLQETWRRSVYIGIGTGGAVGAVCGFVIGYIVAKETDNA